MRAQRHQRDQFPGGRHTPSRRALRDVHRLGPLPPVDHIHRLGEGGLALVQAGQSKGCGGWRGPGWNRSWAQGTRKKSRKLLGTCGRISDGVNHAGTLSCRWPPLAVRDLGAEAAGAVVRGRAAGSAWWRMGACRLNWLPQPAACRRMGRGRRRCGCGGRAWRPGRLAVVRCHAVLRLTELVVVYLARPGSLGSRFGGLFSCFRRGGRQLGQRDRSQSTGAQRQQGGSEDSRHGALPYLTGWPADGFTDIGICGLGGSLLAALGLGILPACMSWYQSSWCSLGPSVGST